MFDAYVTEAKQFVTRHWINELDVTPLFSAIKELLNNVNDHSKSNEIAYTVSQHFPNISELHIAICDFGVGIAKNVKDYIANRTEEEFQKLRQKFEFIKDRDINEFNALRVAFELEFSTQSTPHNRGFGLDTILGYARDLKGSVHLYSNGLHIWYDSKSGESFHSEPLPHDFNGTLLNLTINTTFMEKFYKGDYIEEVVSLG